MKPAPFEYHSPNTIEEAANLLGKHGSEAELMAGNQSLGIIMANRLATPDHIIDINNLGELDYIDITDSSIEIGALARHRTIEQSEGLRDGFPIFPEAAEQIAGPVVRNRGTIGGSIGEADPAGNYPTVITALNAELNLISPDGKRTITADEYFIAYMFTDLREDEIITSIRVDRDPYPSTKTGMAFIEQKPAAQTWPTISAAAIVRIDDPTTESPIIEEARIALGNVDDVPLRVEEAESVIEDTSLSEDALQEAGAIMADSADPEDEVHADETYKRELAEEYTQRAFEVAYSRSHES